MEESEFDYLTGIEKVLVERGYARFKYDHKRDTLVEMKLKGDTSYYFSSVKTLHFYYRKNDVEFIVGLNEKDIPPMLCGCNRKINFNGQYRRIDSCRSIPIQRMLDKIGYEKFIESVENNLKIDFDMQHAESVFYREITKPKDVKVESGYTYQSPTACW